jgi:hypothetical protein
MKTTDYNPYSVFVLQVIKATDTFSLGRREKLGCLEKKECKPESIWPTKSTTNRSTPSNRGSPE